MNGNGLETRLSRILDAECVRLGFRAATPDDAVERLLGPVLIREGFPAEAAASALEAIRNRERAGSTIVGNVALPHARVAGLKRIVASIGLNAEGVFESGPLATRVVLTFASPERATVEHLRFLAQVAQIFRADDVVPALLAAAGSGPGEVLEVLRARERP